MHVHNIIRGESEDRDNEKEEVKMRGGREEYKEAQRETSYTTNEKRK